MNSLRAKIFAGCAVAAALLFMHPAVAQQTIFNVPSADVLPAKTVYLEVDNYFRTWSTSSGTAHQIYGRGVVGVGANVEMGIDSGGHDTVNQSQSFLDYTIKWRPILHELQGRRSPGAIGFYVGEDAGVGLSGATQGKLRSLTYLMGSLKLPDLGARLGVGPNYCTKHEFGTARWGAQVTFEQPIPGVPGLLVAADWFSGDGAYFTPGFIYSRWNFTLYAGYGLANNGRQDDLVTLELGYTFPPWGKKKSQ